MLSIQQSGPVFLGILTLLLVVLVGQGLLAAVAIQRQHASQKVRYHLSNLRQCGLLACVLGMLGQGIGLFLAFRAIEQHQIDVSPKLLWQGVGTSLVTTLYGLALLGVALLLYLVLHRWHQRQHSQASSSS